MGPERVIYLQVAYDGTGYAGWQIQPQVPTVQGAIMEVLGTLEGKPVKVFGASRTDAGVHALGQGASFTTTSTIPPYGYLRGLNSFLPEDISVRAVREMPPGFHARFSARGKRYRYRIWNELSRDPLECRTAWHRLKRLDVEAMARGAAHLVGRHDFESFRSASCDRDNAVRDLTRVEISRAGPLVFVDVEGTAFLKHMVRVMVGSLVEVGRGHRPPDWIAEARDARNRSAAGPTAPPRGLCLERVFYDELPE